MIKRSVSTNRVFGFVRGASLLIVPRNANESTGKQNTATKPSAPDFESECDGNAMSAVFRTATISLRFPSVAVVARDATAVKSARGKTGRPATRRSVWAACKRYQITNL